MLDIAVKINKLNFVSNLKIITLWSIIGTKLLMGLHHRTFQKL